MNYSDNIACAPHCISANQNSLQTKEEIYTQVFIGVLVGSMAGLCLGYMYHRYLLCRQQPIAPTIENTPTQTPSPRLADV